MQELEALCATDFEWASHIEGVWGDPIGDVPEIHRKVRDELARRIDGLASKTASPLGVPVVGEAGSGKTHLLSALRHIAYTKQAGFVLIDLTDVNDFWATAQLGFLAALRRPGPSGQPQYVEILEYALHTHVGEGSGLVDAKKLSGLSADRLATYANVMVRELIRRFPDAAPYRDAIRALAFYNSTDFELNSVGYNWLQGLGIEPADRSRFGFAQEHVPASQVLRALAWLFSLKGPVVVALDQLDAMIAEHHVASGPRSDDPFVAGRQQRSLAIIEAIGTGLLALRDMTLRTLLVPVCLETSWTILQHQVIAAALDRYHPPLVLHKLGGGGEVLRKVIARRLGPAFAAHGVALRHDSWPFAAQAFADASFTPRELLKRCARHVAACVDAGRVLELQSFTDREPAGESRDDPDRLVALDQRYIEEQARAEIASLNGEDHESDLDRLLDLACELLVSEQSFPDGKDVLVDRDFGRTGKLEPLHTRIRLIHHDEGDREEHFSFRILVHDNPVAFQSRLNAAITASGIDRALDFRTLRIVRFTPIPTGKKTAELFAKFEGRGGKLLRPSDGDLRALRALAAIAGDKRGEEFDYWRRVRTPVGKLALFQEVASWLFAETPARPRTRPDAPGTGPEANAKSPDSTRRPSAQPVPGTPPETPPQPLIKGDPRPPPARPGGVPLGARVVPGGGAGESVALPLEQLKRHTVVLAGAGAGKTVLVRRIVEEAALQSIPSIVIDIANDLATFGDAWPDPPEVFDPTDTAKAARFFASTETVVWTPGRAAGNPLKLQLLPDLSALLSSPDEYAEALDLARASLEPWIAAGGAAGKQRAGVLQSALDWFARRGMSGLDNFIGVLTELPSDADGGYDKAEKHARKMADELRAALQMNPLLRTEGTPLDPAVLFGDHAGHSARTRISVINLQGLASLDAQQAFVAQLCTTLFSWVKAHPTPPARPLRGLLVIDEAKDLVPSSGKRPASADALIRLANQARKYGLGLLFATQAPKSIDHNVIANCATQIYGRASSPAALDVIREQLQSRGAHSVDVARFGKGEFYAHTEGLAAPVKIHTRLSLSYHPTNPLDAAGILERAQRIRPSDPGAP
jgi:hypothetical protein